MFQARGTVPHPICGTERGMVDGDKRGRVVQGEVLKVLQASSCCALETPYGKDSAIEL